MVLFYFFKRARVRGFETRADGDRQGWAAHRCCAGDVGSACCSWPTRDPLVARHLGYRRGPPRGRMFRARAV